MAQAELKKALGENASMKRRLKDLNCVRNRLKCEVEELKRQQHIWLQTCSADNYGKVKELIGYIEHQRNVYKESVERLIGKLDPDGSRVEKSLAEADEQGKPKAKASSEQILKDIQNQSRRILQQSGSPKPRSTRNETTELENSYHPSEYRNASSAARDSQNAETSSRARWVRLDLPDYTTVFRVTEFNYDPTTPCSRAAPPPESREDDATQRQRVERILSLEREIANVKEALSSLREDTQYWGDPTEVTSPRGVHGTWCAMNS